MKAKPPHTTSLIAKIDETLEPLPSWIAQFRDERGRYRYLLDSEKPYCLYTTSDGLGLAAFLGANSEETREGAIEFLRSCQSREDGYFHCPVCADYDGDEAPTCSEDNRDGITFKVAANLFMNGSAPPYPLPDGMMFTGDIGAKLGSVFQEHNPYFAGSVVWKKTGMRALKLLSEGTDPREDSYVTRILDWLRGHQDEEAGLWFPGGDLVNGMDGLLKMRYGTFDPCGMEIPQAEKILTTILSIPEEGDGRFGEACADWNGAGLLADLGRRAPAFRDRIVQTYAHVLPAFIAKRDPVRGGLAMDPGQKDGATLKSTYINGMSLLAIKYFLTGNDRGIDELFFMNALRKNSSLKAENNLSTRA
jgi:hypothetical protein